MTQIKRITIEQRNGEIAVYEDIEAVFATLKIGNKIRTVINGEIGIEFVGETEKRAKELTSDYIRRSMREMPAETLRELMKMVFDGTEDEDGVEQDG